jgi:CelD/BcsL family acetyltransferase involved in cellulose biosynthesis
LFRTTRGTFELSAGTAKLTAHREAWDSLAALLPSPFLTHAWLVSSVQAPGGESPLCATLCDSDGTLLAGALLRRVPGGLASAGAGEDWDVVAVDEDARRALWEELARLAPKRLHLAQMRVGSPGTEIACNALRSAGYGVLPSVREESCPYVAFPGTFDELLASRSRNARQQVRSRRRDLDRAGKVSFRTTCSGSGLERDFDAFVRLEASGWKGREGTAIASRPESRSFYYAFVREAAECGWLRLHLLELDGTLVAGSLVLAFGGEGFFLKTGFDESRAQLGPGVVIMAEMLRAACEEGLRGMDLLGRADQYKMRWTDTTRPRQRLRVYRGPVGRIAQRGWNGIAHPRLVALRDRARTDPQLRHQLERAQHLLDRRPRS